MKQSKTSYEETTGMIVGALIAIIYVFNINDLLIFFPVLFTYQAGYFQMGYWIKYGPLFFFIFTFAYLAAQKVIDDKRKKEHLIVIKSSIIGFFLWLIIITASYSLDFEIDDMTNLLGGFTTILLMTLYMKKVSCRQTKGKDGRCDA